MAHIRFSPGAIVDVRGAEYHPAYAHGRVQLTHLITGEIFKYEQQNGSLELPTVEQFQLMQNCGDAVTRTPRSSDPIRNYNDRAEWTRDQASAISSRALRMATACQMLDERGVPQGRGAIEAALDQCWTSELIDRFGTKPSASSVKSWRRSRGSIGNRHPRHMVPLSGRHTMLPPDGRVDQQLLWACILEGRKAGLKVDDIHSDYTHRLKLVNEGRHPFIDKPAQPFKICSERTVRRRFNELESDKTLATSIEVEAVKQDWSGAGKPLAADLVMQYVIVDHTRLDVHVVCPALQMVLGRPWLTLAIDVKSRAIVGHLITFHDPSGWSVSEILRRIVLPKRPPPAMASRYPVLAMLCGKPGCLILDNAVEFRSHTLEAAARDAGFSVRFCPIKQPTYRAIGERAIKTLNDQITRLLPGRALTLNDARRWGYDAEAQAIVMLDELEAIANQIVASYNVEPHDGLGGRQPSLVFERDINRFGINDFADFASFARDVMEVRSGAQLSPTGIRAFNLRYHDIQAVPELLRDLVPIEPRRQRRSDATATVEFRYDSMDISRIHVWNRKTRKYVELTCADETYSGGMPLWLHEQIEREAQKQGLAFNTQEERMNARGHLIDAIRNISPGDLAASRKRLATLIEVPRIRQVTGNIVDLVHAGASSVTLGDFIANDRAKLTSLDQDILSSRPDPRAKPAKSALDRRREHAGEGQIEPNAPVRERRLRMNKGGYQ
ncbi:hypothetical protein [Sphingomonas sp. GC_Shp_3]|uniref:hypothetical protein n=1 Tax=Sphingomonas sp. GC_Shp_3 TaxID=2937383 RepID=UPI002269BB16|nr:hypothetical protein [Sphingomonas sp. GC_Shp_3]